MRHFLDLAKCTTEDGSPIDGDSLPTYKRDSHRIEWPAGEGERSIYLPIDALPLPLIEAISAARSALLYVRMGKVGSTDDVIPTVAAGSQSFAVSGVASPATTNDLEEPITTAAGTYMPRGLVITATGGVGVVLLGSYKLKPGANPHDVVHLLAAWVDIDG